jgi:uncharacterized protein YigE (DUF2233 family)
VKSDFTFSIINLPLTPVFYSKSPLVKPSSSSLFYTTRQIKYIDHIDKKTVTLTAKAMKQKKIFILTSLLSIVVATSFIYTTIKQPEDNLFISYTTDPKKEDIKFYWKDDKKNRFGSIDNLKLRLSKNKQKLVFAMNGGMYKPDYSPQGLFIESTKTLSPLDTSSGAGNFYLKPNGVFYIATNNTPAICSTTDFTNNGQIKYATQSGPMLVINNQIHPSFKEGSSNLNIRNGVGILQGNKIVFAMSKKEINLYDFAKYFKNLGCKNALYLDGLVSRTYLPEKNWTQTDGDFGVIIGISKKF